ncbi:MAG: hypothetical protein FJW30_19410 [Acidobacteria bacterium]|nr:hypothetical protein [Acidobacteriota bacterium]
MPTGLRRRSLPTAAAACFVPVSQHNLYHVPLRDLLVNLRVLLEKRMFSVTAAGSAVEQLRAEFHRWGRRSAHDGLIFAIALAAWKAEVRP